jgi:hypothetical protein
LSIEVKEELIIRAIKREVVFRLMLIANILKRTLNKQFCTTENSRNLVPILIVLMTV